MPNQIFKSLFLLSFSDPKIATEYYKKSCKIIKKNNKITPWIILLTSIGLLITLLAKKSSYKKNQKYNKTNYFLLFLFIIIVIVFDVIIIILNYIFRKSQKAQTIIGCIIYAKINLNFAILKIMLELIFFLETGKYSFVNFLDFVVRDFFHYFGIVEFSQSILINIFLPMIVLIIYYCSSVINSLIYDSCIFFILLNIGLIVSSYFVTKLLKKNFFLLNELDQVSNKRRTIINKLNTGYIKIKNEKIAFINNSLLRILEKSKQMFFTQKDLEIRRIDLIMEILIGWKGNEMSTNVETETIFVQTKQIDIILNQIQSFYEDKVKNQRQNEGDFIFLKYQTIELINCEKESITYEIFIKSESNVLEFILNDITRIKEYEKKEFEVKMQNVFLTKIAHEFKNPLLCIQELINQIIENLQKIFNKKEFNEAIYNIISKNCHLATSFSEYLLLLIKDADYFLNNEYDQRIAKPNHIIFEKINISEFVNFCNDVAKVKIFHLNKSNKIQYISFVGKDVPQFIQTDSMKLKQIIINLLSNSIKYTDKGKIVFEISFDKNSNSIKFSIEDTGIGIKDEVQNIIKNRQNGKINSTTLGITIIKNLTQELGSEIHFKSISHKGTVFWFFLPLISEKNINKLASFHDNLNTSIKTLKLDELELNYSFEKKNYIISTEQLKILNIIFTDDEDLARKAIIRIFKDISLKNNIILNPIEAKDGIETVYKIYQNYFSKADQELKINAIISDQKMNYVNGTTSHQILSSLTNLSKNYIPFFIVTAYDCQAKFFDGVKCCGIYSKPLRKLDAEKIFEKIINCNTEF